METAVALQQIEDLRAAGFTKAADDAEAKLSFMRKLARAYELYRYVKQEQIDAFIAKLKAKTERDPSDEEVMKQTGYKSLAAFKAAPYLYRTATIVRPHDTLALTAMESYKGMPPSDVLAKVKEAKAENIFDTFEVAHVEPVSTKIYLPDPIVFGRVNGCSDRFFIAEWGNDVKLADLIGPNEG